MYQIGIIGNAGNSVIVPQNMKYLNQNDIKYSQSLHSSFQGNVLGSKFSPTYKLYEKLNFTYHL